MRVTTNVAPGVIVATFVKEKVQPKFLSHFGFNLSKKSYRSTGPETVTVQQFFHIFCTCRSSKYQNYDIKKIVFVATLKVSVATCGK